MQLDRLGYIYICTNHTNILSWNISSTKLHCKEIKVPSFILKDFLLHFKSNQIKSLLLSHHHSTSALVSEILMSVLQTVQKNNRQFTYGQTVQKKTTDNLHMDRQCKNCTGAFTVLQTVQKNNNSNLHMDRQCKKATAIYIWTVHIYRLYRRQCAKYTYIYSVHIVYYKDILNYQRHIIHRMGTSALCTVSIHNVVYA